MKTKIYVKNNLTTDEYDHDYTVKHGKKKLKLKYSKNGDWAKQFKNTIALILEDDGNNVFIDKLLKKGKLTLNYSEVLKLHCLLMTYFNSKKRKIKI